MPDLRTALLAMSISVTPIIAAAQTPSAGTDRIVGQDAMGDKGRTGPDGWSWAPVTRSQVPSGAAGQHAATTRAAPNAQPDPGADRTLPPGEDPGTPDVARAKGPGSTDRPAVAR